jgi:hypothetical protein
MMYLSRFAFPSDRHFSYEPCRGIRVFPFLFMLPELIIFCALSIWRPRIVFWYLAYLGE